MLENQLWYAGPISERKAEEILARLRSPGCFLVRDSLLPEANYVLSIISSEGQMTHFPIVIGKGNECTVNNYTFNNIQTAVKFYSENRLAGVFLNLPAKPVIDNTNRTHLHNQPVVRTVQLPKPITEISSLAPSQRGAENSKENHRCMMYGGGASTNKKPAEKLGKVNFDDQLDNSSEDEGTPLIRYQSKEGPIYTLPRKPSHKKANNEGSELGNNNGNTFSEKKALFEQLAQPDIIAMSTKEPNEDEHKLNHFKPGVLLPPPPPPPPPVPPRHPPPTPPKPSPKKPLQPPGGESPSIGRRFPNVSCETLMYDHEGYKTIWGPAGPTIAVPTAILAGMKFRPFAMFKNDSYEDDSLSNDEDGRSSSEVTMAMGLTPPSPPTRVESRRCGNLRKHSFIYNSIDSMLELEGEARVMYNKTERVGSPASVEEVVVIQNLGRFARFKNFFRWK